MFHLMTARAMDQATEPELSTSIDSGQGLAEYALILALIAIVAIVALLFLGDQISRIINDIGKSM